MGVVIPQSLESIANMGNPDHELLERWVACCNGDDDPENHCFSTLLMELFDDFGDAERGFVQAVCKPFANGRQLAGLLIRTTKPAEVLTDRQLTIRLKKFTGRDIAQKMGLLVGAGERKLANRIRKLPIVCGSWEELEFERELSEFDELYRLHVENALALGADPYEYALSEAVYYGFANDLRFQRIFETYLLEEAEPLVSEFELWLMGAGYVIANDRVLAAQQPPPDDAMIWPDDFE